MLRHRLGEIFATSSCHIQVKTKQKVMLSECRASGNVPYSKSTPGYCITFKKRLEEGLDSNFSTKLLILPELHIEFARQKLNWGARATWSSILCLIIVVRVYVERENAKKNWNWGNNRFLVSFLPLVVFQLGGTGPPAPLPPGYVYGCYRYMYLLVIAVTNNIALKKKTALATQSGGNDTMPH